MVRLKNKDILYAVVRKDEMQDVICAFAANPVRAEELKGEYEQSYFDAWGPEGQSYYYVTANTFYE